MVVGCPSLEKQLKVKASENSAADFPWNSRAQVDQPSPRLKSIESTNQVQGIDALSS